jgi:hypothetical protein
MNYVGVDKDVLDEVRATLIGLGENDLAYQILKSSMRYSPIVQPWAASLGLRHQGVLMSAVRGPDGVPREDPIKVLVRMFRGVVLTPHCQDVKLASSYMMPHIRETFQDNSTLVLKSLDHYNLHFFMHFTHAVQIVGYHYPESPVNRDYNNLYHRICKKLHINPETVTQLELRLNADEKTFALSQAL